MNIRLATHALLILLLALLVGCPTNRGRGGGGGGGDDDDSGPDDDDDVTDDDDDVVDHDDDDNNDDYFQGTWVEEYTGDVDCSNIMIWMLQNDATAPPCAECDYTFSVDQGLIEYDCPAWDGNLTMFERFVGFDNSGGFWLYLDAWTQIGDGSISGDSFDGASPWEDSGSGYQFRITLEATW